MMLNLMRFNFLIPLFFFLCIFYWFPLVNTEILSLIKFFLLIFLGFYSLVLVPKINSRILIFELFIIFFSILYELFSNGQGDFLLNVLVFIFIYEVGCRSNIKEITSFYLISTSMIFSWVFLSFFFVEFDVKNNLFLDYSFRDINLSSTGFSIARTSWGISVVLLFLFLFQYNSSRFLKSILMLSAILCVITTNSRTALMCFFMIILTFIYIYINKPTIKFLLILLSCFLFVVVYYFLGEFLRITGVDDLSNGRLESYFFVDKFIHHNIFLGWYKYGGYDLQNYGYSYSQFHNAWVHLFLEYGVLGFLIVISWFLYCLFNLNIRENNDKICLFLIIICGGFTTIFEPEVIFSNGYHLLIFWFTLGVLSSRNFYIKDVL